jgi:antitoxin component YwqK of YwqJK toxin-antitoxin module
MERIEVYSAGVQDGRWLNFAADGKTVLAVRRFDKGEPEGKWYAWHSPLYKRFEYEFLDGRQHGVARAWHSNGAKWFEGTYVNGKRDGEWTEWDQAGRVLKRNTWKEGQQVANRQ